MADLVSGIGLWIAVSVVAALMFALGAGLGYRSGWEAGHAEGRRTAGEAHPGGARRPPRAG